MASTKHITRRSILKAAPAAVVTAAAPAALAEPESEVMRLFREWNAARMNRPSDDADQATFDAWCDKTLAIAKRMAPLPIRSASDLAAKLIAESCAGDLYLPPSVEMYELVGVPPVAGAMPFGKLPSVV